MLSDVPGNKLNIYTDDYCIFDLETTGISPKKDEVIEISAIKVKGGEVVDKVVGASARPIYEEKLKSLL